MVNIIITPAYRDKPGTLVAEGHAQSAKAGKEDLVCCAITTLMDALTTNLQLCWDVRTETDGKPGRLRIRWSKARARCRGMERANNCAGFVYNALRSIETDYPKNLHVEWRRAE